MGDVVGDRAYSVHMCGRLECALIVGADMSGGGYVSTKQWIFTQIFLYTNNNTITTIPQHDGSSIRK